MRNSRWPRKWDARALPVYRRPRVCHSFDGRRSWYPVEDTPGPFQIRNSNSISLAAQVTLAGGEAAMLGNRAGRSRRNCGRASSKASSADMLVLSGGVSVGKYDLVEQALRDLGAEFFFDAVAIRPGKPAVFGWCAGKPVFGLPGNPVSTMVTFELFVRARHRAAGRASAAAAAVFQGKACHPLTKKATWRIFFPRA